MSEIDTDIRVELWATATGWSAEQMAWLVIGCDPDRVVHGELDYELAARFGNVHRDILSVLEKKYDGTPRSLLPSPSEAIERMRLGEIEFPPELVAAVERLGKPQYSPSSKSGSTRETNTLRKVLLAIAVAEFGHSSQKGKGAAGRISTLTRESVLPLSEDTIREHLDKALQELDQEEKDILFGRKDKRSK